MSIVFAILIFSAVILFHEFGHFLLARKNGIIVNEFSLGMGPRILSFEKNGTRYSWKLIPLGGSCAMAGEDTSDTSEGTFHSASVWGRIAVVAAGPVFNFILAFAAALVIIGIGGYNPAKVMEVTKGSAAEKAGLQEGDVITRYQGYSIDLGKDLYIYTYLNEPTEDTVYLQVKRDGEKMEIVYDPDVEVRYLLGFNRASADAMEIASLIPGMGLEEAGAKAGDVITEINGVDVPDGEAYDAYIQKHPLDGTPVLITYVRDGLEYETEVIPMEYRTPDLGFSYYLGTEKANLLQTIQYSAVEVKYMIRTTILSLKELLTGHLGVEELSGPVGVVSAIEETYEETRKEGPLITFLSMMNMLLLLSANLGVMNLLPIPALDGGRLVFLIIEAIRGKPIDRELEGGVHFAGMMLLLALMAFVMYNDIAKLL
ncbi:MAG: RIP metalloprotease RseP [Blautia sp.]|nr:RIP metalloprotease RseP [Blautia sp.]